MQLPWLCPKEKNPPSTNKTTLVSFIRQFGCLPFRLYHSWVTGNYFQLFVSIKNITKCYTDFVKRNYIYIFIMSNVLGKEKEGNQIKGFLDNYKIKQRILNLTYACACTHTQTQEWESIRIQLNQFLISATYRFDSLINSHWL